MATNKHVHKDNAAKGFWYKISVVIVIGVILFIGLLLLMTGGVINKKSKKINYYTQNVRINEPFYEVFTGVFHHRFGRVWHEKQSVLGKNTISALVKQKFIAEHMLKNLNLYDKGLLPIQIKGKCNEPKQIKE